MKKTVTIFGAIILASFILTSCGGNSIENDAKRYAELMCKAQKLAIEGNGDMSSLTESMKYTAEAASLAQEMQGKYKDAVDYQKFTAAYLEAMTACNGTPNKSEEENKPLQETKTNQTTEQAPVEETQPEQSTETQPLSDGNNENSKNILEEGNAMLSVEKSFFYREADLTTKRNAFLVKGQYVEFSSRNGDFIFCKYTNENGKVTEGWMLSSEFSNFNSN